MSDTPAKKDESTIEITLNGKKINVPAHATILQACDMLGVEIPRFCYHERLSIAGNCRMCLVEVDGSPKPVASCAAPLRAGMVVQTNSKMVVEARKNVMEFLLINHPLDCPICDQGGECDLQDQALGFGMERSRFADNKRAVADKDMGPLVKTIMTRCIHCTRCVRFASEVAGVPEIGALGRGEDMEIVSWLDGALKSEMAGNVIDLCPVGALTSKPYVFKARPWELTKCSSIDVMDGLGSNIRVDVRGNEVMRILPREHDAINEEWLSDKSRFVWDGIARQRLDTPWMRVGKTLKPCSWAEALAAAGKRLAGTKPEAIGALAGDLACVESMFALKGLMGQLRSPNLDCRQSGALYPTEARANYIMNSGIAGIYEADAVLLVGTNPRTEAAVLNARLYQHWRRGDKGATPIGVIGEQVDLPYDNQWLGAGLDTLRALAAGQGEFAEELQQAKTPLLLFGEAATRTEAVFYELVKLARHFKIIGGDWNGFNMLHHAAARVGGLDVGFVPQKDKGGLATNEMLQKGKIETLILLGADEAPLDALSEKTCVIYIGSHGDRGAARADIVLPAACYVEKQALYVNTEGRPQMTMCARPAPGEAKDDWAIVRALSEHCGGTPLPYDDVGELRRALFEKHPHLQELDALPAKGIPTTEAPAAQKVPAAQDMTKKDSAKIQFATSVPNFYLSNPIARSSPVMGECSRRANAREAAE